MSLTRKVAQLEAQVNSDASVRDSLSFREQSWQDERSELREEITSLRQEISSVKATKDDYFNLIKAVQAYLMVSYTLICR